MSGTKHELNDERLLVFMTTQDHTDPLTCLWWLFQMLLSLKSSQLIYMQREKDVYEDLQKSDF